MAAYFQAWLSSPPWPIPRPFGASFRIQRPSCLLARPPSWSARPPRGYPDADPIRVAAMPLIDQRTRRWRGSSAGEGRHGRPSSFRPWRGSSAGEGAIIAPDRPTHTLPCRHVRQGQVLDSRVSVKHHQDAGRRRVHQKEPAGPQGGASRAKALISNQNTHTEQRRHLRTKCTPIFLIKSLEKGNQILGNQAPGVITCCGLAPW